MPKFESPDRVVIALGGNALGDTPEEQIARVRAAAPTGRHDSESVCHRA